MDALDFTGRGVLVTGGTRGIGAVIARAFLEAGAEVLVCARREPPDLPRVADRQAHFAIADIRDPAQAEALIRTAVTRLGTLDVLVNNAGGAPFALADTASPRLHAKIIELNLTAPLHVSQAANAVMQSQPTGGAIIMIGSMSGARPSPGTAAYGAAKAGLHHLAATLAMEWAPRVRVNTLVVGPVDTSPQASSTPTAASTPHKPPTPEPPAPTSAPSPTPTTSPGNTPQNPAVSGGAPVPSGQAAGNAGSGAGEVPGSVAVSAGEAAGSAAAAADEVSGSVAVSAGEAAGGGGASPSEVAGAVPAAAGGNGGIVAGHVSAAAVARTVPMGRAAMPAEVADACLFLASPLAAFVSGAALAVHGGGEWPGYLAEFRAGN